MSDCDFTYDIDSLDKICRKFSVKGKIFSVGILTQGHINRTFDISYSNGKKIDRYILQYVNSYVFKKPVEVMENTALVTNHIKNRLINLGIDHSRMVLEFFSAGEKNYYIDELGDFWRLRRNITNSVSYGKTGDLYIIEEAGRAFGNFQNYLADFDADKLHIVIPHFHNTKFRFEDLKKSGKTDFCGRFNKCERLFAEYILLEQVATQMYELQRQGRLPLRVTHNDTKINNVLFDKDTKKHLAVIDLDTIMPGLIGFDYGDAIRFTANASLEDEENLSEVYLDFDKFSAFTKGFVGKTKNTITKEELATLSLGAITMTIECGVRFLTDYLNGDKYFCIEYPEQNLMRSRCQLKLAKDMLEHQDKMQNIINGFAIST